VQTVHALLTEGVRCVMHVQSLLYVCSVMTWYHCCSDWSSVRLLCCCTKCCRWTL